MTKAVESRRHKRVKLLVQCCVTIVLTLTVDIVVRKCYYPCDPFLRMIYELRQSASYKRAKYLFEVLKELPVDPTATSATYIARLKQLLVEFLLDLLEILYGTR